MPPMPSPAINPLVTSTPQIVEHDDEGDDEDGDGDEHPDDADGAAEAAARLDSAGALLARLSKMGWRSLGAPCGLCGTDPDHVHWRTVLGAFWPGRGWFMIAFAARLVAGYAGAPSRR